MENNILLAEFVGVVAKNNGDYKETHPFKLSITNKEAKKILKEYYNYTMFVWLFKTKEEAMESLREDTKKVKLFHV